MARKSGHSAAITAGLAFGLAIGLGLGTYVLSPNLSGGSSHQRLTLEKERDEARERADIQAAQASSADHFVDKLAASVLPDTLKERPILMIRTADSSDEDAKALSEDLKRAGAINSGTISLTEKFFAQDGADGLKNIVSTVLPAGAQLSTDKLDPGTHAGEVLGSALTLNPQDAKEQATRDERSLVLNALREGGYLSYEEGTILPAQAVVVLGGDSDGVGADFTVKNQVSFVEALDSRGSGVVFAGRIHMAADSGALGKLRANKKAASQVSSVDSIDRSWGKIATVLALKEQLSGGAGAYGAAGNADATAPAPNEDKQ
ncbi:Hypothetical protein Cul210931_1029 [Corynebacterium ulcerans]|uniref:Copper transporter n=1 Tax=Corynebacterium ulcerans FRC58 TaxID=1408268 RepID=A0ABN4H1N6_CORUL|nr:copper transporter [Corynebacterium ulcerans]AIU30374.1 Hypothetical protein Cul210931_1029 [Corynebacterium ulcerans]AKN76961.1 Hypothetical protein CulFRC58_1107 [Corynebacterium ulcerans FRC58]MBH5298462.1 copper transporter [Corynebacterium ulcerans]NOL62627.1 copper transporter [Corynebacterium ulcerans]NON16223.1 copper transporter [Corynebacterium ulcerans]